MILICLCKHQSGDFLWYLCCTRNYFMSVDMHFKCLEKYIKQSCQFQNCIVILQTKPISNQSIFTLYITWSVKDLLEFTEQDKTLKKKIKYSVSIASSLINWDFCDAVHVICITYLFASQSVQFASYIHVYILSTTQTWHSSISADGIRYMIL